MDIEEKALIFSRKAHGNQLRKYTNEPYIVHPVAVAKIVKSVKHTPEMVAAALLHDTVEDTSVTLEEIGREFGSIVEEFVYWLTDVSKPQDGNRNKRKSADRNHISNAPAEAKTIKIADLIDNTSTISKFDPKFWKLYKEEKIKLLEVLQEGDAHLMILARSLLWPLQNHKLNMSTVE